MIQQPPQKSPQSAKRAEEMPKAPKECPVCLEEIQADEVDPVVTDCMHIFHWKCITRSLMERDACPVCNSKIPYIRNHLLGLPQAAERQPMRLPSVIESEFELIRRDWERLGGIINDHSRPAMEAALRSSVRDHQPAVAQQWLNRGLQITPDIRHAMEEALCHASEWDDIEAAECWVNLGVHTNAAITGLIQERVANNRRYGNHGRENRWRDLLDLTEAIRITS